MTSAISPRSGENAGVDSPGTFGEGGGRSVGESSIGPKTSPYSALSASQIGVRVNTSYNQSFLMRPTRASRCVAALIAPTLALWGVATNARAQQASPSTAAAPAGTWTDPSPHRVRMVTVAPNVSLEV